MKSFLTLLLLLYLNIYSYSQNYTQTIKGKITDKESKQTLVGVNVIINSISPPIGTVSDTSGFFRIENVPVGRHTIQFSYIGYKEVIIPEILVQTGKEPELNIELTESVMAMQEVTIKATRYKNQALNSMAATSARVLSMDDASRYAAGFYDPSRMVSSFAGVAAVEGDGVNDIVIRGNSPRGLLWRLEGIEIPNPNHF
ncbi:MAG: carboxypeptidase-like regulatory domain-containing protein, partial [Bacteroidales bacterium]|nr:carboxypeptidase-like regulatory domain-containing protein [Bacteroidales bacterium]